VRSQLLQFLEFQRDDGLILDAIGFDGTLIRGTVETDQESSLVQAVAKYVAITGDTAVLSQQVRGVSVIERLEDALMYLYTQRFSQQYQLVWGGTRADWGDIQPEDPLGTSLTPDSHPSIGIYDNAMLSLALAGLQNLELAAGRDATAWAARQRELRTAVRAHLWTGTQFIPHLYLEKGSPFPASFDEVRMYFQGGTAVAIQAGLLEPAEVSQTFARMVRNKVDSGSGSVGVTLFPAYPAHFFQNTYWMGAEYFYQNGGDWPWFGARIIQQMVAHGQVELAWREVGPMLDRVIRDDGIYEWYTRDGQARGSAEYRGSCGQLALAIDMLLHWAAAH
jgi:glycogen debranching enzyme